MALLAYRWWGENVSDHRSVSAAFRVTVTEGEGAGFFSLQVNTDPDLDGPDHNLSRYATRSLHFMDAYHKRLDGKQAAFAMRQIPWSPDNVFDELEKRLTCLYRNLLFKRPLFSVHILHHDSGHTLYPFSL